MYPQPIPSGGAGAREAPICVALVLCDQVIEDVRTGNKSLIGLFHGISTAALPAVHPRLTLFAAVTSGRGPWAFTFRITTPSGQELMRMQDTVEITDPLAVHDLVVEVRSLPLTEEGVHFVDFLLGPGEAPLANRRFAVRVETDEQAQRRAEGGA